MSLIPRSAGGVRPAAARPADFGSFVRETAQAGTLVVQPRMGFSDPRQMRAGLAAVKAADASTVGTITLDSYTRVGELDAVKDAMRDGIPLNGYPIVSYDSQITQGVLEGLRDDTFPVQVRHGSAVPDDIFSALIALRLNATEGGPVSYCLPYGRTSLPDSVRNWARCAERFAGLREEGVEPHLETFGGCMLGQLCPPSQLVAISVLEALFFCHHGVRSVSLSYAQQTNPEQDEEAVFALRRLCSELLPTRNWHVVIYAYMGVYPTSPAGATRLLARAAELAAATGSERIIVKTIAEAHRIPTIAENIEALECADLTARHTPRALTDAEGRDRQSADSETYQEARALVDAVLNLDADLGKAFLTAFRRGYLDIPYCLHPDNAGRARSRLDERGRLVWAQTGSLPLRHLVREGKSQPATSWGLLGDLSYVRRTYDEMAAQELSRTAASHELNSAA